MGLFDAFRNARIDSVAESTRARGLQKGNHLENCERCDHSVRNSKSPTGLSCRQYQEHIPASGVCGHFTR